MALCSAAGSAAAEAAASTTAEDEVDTTGDVELFVAAESADGVVLSSSC